MAFHKSTVSMASPKPIHIRVSWICGLVWAGSEANEPVRTTDPGSLEMGARCAVSVFTRVGFSAGKASEVSHGDIDVGHTLQKTTDIVLGAPVDVEQSDGLTLPGRIPNQATRVTAGAISRMQAFSHYHSVQLGSRLQLFI
jgi:hypothetical protein